MNKGVFIKISFGFFFVLVVMIIALSIDPKEVETEGEVEEPTISISDFGVLKNVDLVSVLPTSYKSNFAFKLDKGDYHQGDALYVVRKNQSVVYTKYILSDKDVKSLKADSMNLYLTYPGKVDMYQFSYLVVPKEDVQAFEDTFTKDDEGNYRNISHRPLINEVKGTSSLEDFTLTQDEVHLNNELIRINLMQSQQYSTDTKIQVMDSKQTVLKEVSLTQEMVEALTKDNLYVEVNFNDVVDSVEDKTGIQRYYIKFINEDESYQGYYFQIIVNQ